MRVRKLALLEFIRSRDSVTFPEIEAFFLGKRYKFQGDTAMVLSGRVVWHRWSHKAAAALWKLYQEEKIDLVDDEKAPIPPPRTGEEHPGYPYRQVMIKAR